jgi:hypothetical protein
MEDVGIFYGQLVYFTYSHLIFYGHVVYFLVIWYTFPNFGIVYQEKSDNPDSYRTKVYVVLMYVERRSNLSTTQTSKVLTV